MVIFIILDPKTQALTSTTALNSDTTALTAAHIEVTPNAGLKLEDIVAAPPAPPAGAHRPTWRAQQRRRSR